MKLEALDKLSTKALLAIQEHVNKLLDERLDRTINIGSYGTFVCQRGKTRVAEVMKINAKTLQVRETAASIESGKIWKLSHSLFKVEAKERTNVAIVKPSPPAPSPSVTYSDESW